MHLPMILTACSLQVKGCPMETDGFSMLCSLLLYTCSRISEACPMNPKGLSMFLIKFARTLTRTQEGTQSCSTIYKGAHRLWKLMQGIPKYDNWHFHDSSCFWIHVTDAQNMLRKSQGAPHYLTGFACMVTDAQRMIIKLLWRFPWLSLVWKTDSPIMNRTSTDRGGSMIPFDFEYMYTDFQKLFNQC